ncbi:putative tRNA-splicing endonuclease subunit sen54 [Fulvia fulva]|uniref:tRNA-splicing endonuclease subunit sen54 n=1 Tax=Passalora fulva TaxID=5499 RepID=A0A9Q8PEG4_PASFU|nr:putative tRNA-splicing endonuclease subunit sen54 [Fulvia fulva]KAK4617648.1 putative tRNA-splicing endonuclease subunit sen54 [Fulvia fulva]KAK4618845.1 putative tRNA-splicing endonuclease subunit sen54 [Fulvia fulva]UJO20968.1 putative tRNA-splicing endonuclease subunit sen54 [Fulvia fulva]WPV17788.1 putative tRNA-splicing endonuclease subunit sen54 [Fulvia fulva]WPV33451.1 putative tRNA-splicing endonuclease subunit sen54 [Fulvia fulva]
MADVDEDAIPRPGLNTVTGGEEDAAPDDEVVDYRFLSALTKDSSATVIPKRGEKDFEEHGTALQSNTLAASRQAMHNALAHERIHQPKTHTIGHYHPETNTAYAVNPKGPLYQKMGHVKAAKDDPLGSEERGQRLWLLPEEVLYLIERGTLDVRWPPVDGEDEGVPMSLQGAYAMFVGDEQVLTSERYNVYAALKRMGYTVLRAPSFEDSGPAPGSWCYPPPTDETFKQDRSFSASALWKLLYRPRTQDNTAHHATGPIIQPGLYRDYDTIYRRLSLINFHDPTSATQPAEQEPPNTDPNFRITYHVWKPGSTTFKKSNPGTPDFRIAVVNARETTAPTLEQLSALMMTAPWDPPKREGKLYAELKHGYKNVILAVVDQGITSYLRIADAAFGLDKVYERRSQASGKRGGRGGGRGGRGRGRGRGR